VIASIEVQLPKGSVVGHAGHQGSGPVLILLAGRPQLLVHDISLVFLEVRGEANQLGFVPGHGIRQGAIFTAQLSGQVLLADGLVQGLDVGVDVQLHEGIS